MKAWLIALVLVLAPCAALGKSDQDWQLCKAVDADHLAIPACTRLIEANNLAESDRAIAHSIRGKAHWRERDFDEAIADENKAIEINPDLAGAFVTRGAAYGGKRDDDQALADANKAIDLDPGNAQAYSNRGVARGHKDDLDGAIADTTRAIDINPKLALGFIARGEAYQKKHEPGRAYAEFGKATEIDPKGGFDGYRIRGLAFLLKSDYGHAIADFTAMIEVDPANAEAHNRQGRLYTRNLDYDRASTILPDRSRLIPTMPMPIASAASPMRQSTTMARLCPITIRRSR